MSTGDFSNAVMKNEVSQAFLRKSFPTKINLVTFSNRIAVSQPISLVIPTVELFAARSYESCGHFVLKAFDYIYFCQNLHFKGSLASFYTTGDTYIKLYTVYHLLYN